MYELLQAGIHSLLVDVQKEYEYRQSDAAIQEDCEANDWRFTKSGDFVDH